jgi:hypothetical protein
MNTQDTQQLDTKQLPVAHMPNIIKATPEIYTDSITSTEAITCAVMRLKELKRQEKTLKKLIKADEEQVKDFMGDNLVLVDKYGNELATYKWDADREDLDKKALKLNFADVYYTCVETVAGSRRFLLAK